MFSIDRYFLEVDFLRVVGIVAISILFVLIAEIVMHLHNKFSSYDVVLYMRVEEYLLSFLTALWIFNLFSLRVAIIIWFGCFLVLRKILRKNDIVEENLKSTSFSQPNQIGKSLFFLHSLQHNKKSILQRTSTKQKKIVQSLEQRAKHFFLFFKTYLGGLLVPAITLFCFDTKSVNTNDLLLEKNLIMLTAILYYAYIIGYYATVENEVSFFYDDKFFYNLMFCSFGLFAYILVIAYSLIIINH